MVVVISNPTPVKDELSIIHQLFGEGLEVFHLRKKDYPESEVRKIIEKIPEKYFGKIVLHSHYYLTADYKLKGIHVPDSFKNKTITGAVSTSFHSLEEMKNARAKFEYAFLSPVFDSISKVGYKSKLDLKEIKEFLKNRSDKIVALGGIDEDKVDAVKDAGFSGVALLGSIWQNENPVAKYKGIAEKWGRKQLAY